MQDDNKNTRSKKNSANNSKNSLPNPKTFGSKQKNSSNVSKSGNMQKKSGGTSKKYSTTQKKSVNRNSRNKNTKVRTRANNPNRSANTNIDSSDFESWQVNYDEYRPTDFYYPQKDEGRKSSSFKKEKTSQKRKKPSTDKYSKANKASAVTWQEHIQNSDNSFNDDFFVDEVALRKKQKKLMRIKEGEQKKAPKIKEPISRKKRKARNIIVSAAILAVVVIVGVVLSLTVLFQCETINVEGVTKYSAEQLVAASGISTGENLFLSDRKTAKNNILASFPYVSEVNVSIQIPNTMQITVTEAVPSYLIKSGKKYVIVSESGRILDHTNQNVLGVPIIMGCKLTSDEIGDYIDIKDQKVIPVINEISVALHNNGVSGIKEIDISDIANIKLNYEDRISIILGMPEDLDYKIRTAMTIIKDELAVTDKGDLDVSNCNSGRKASYFNPDYSIKEKATIPVENQTQPISDENTDASSDAMYNESSVSNEENEYDSYADDYAAQDNYSDGYTDYYNDDIYDDNYVAYE